MAVTKRTCMFVCSRKM